jgi:3-oxoacyl-[acyl-carrier protein] reductase
MAGKLAGQVACVTGAAGGIGRSVCELFAKEDASVALLDAKGDALNDAVKAIAAMGVEAEGFQTDVTDREQVFNTVNSIISRFKRLDILINNAGIAIPTRFQDISLQEWNKVLNVNLTGAFNMSQAVLPQMIKQHYGRIIMMASAAGKRGSVAAGAHYSVSKGGIILLARALAREVGRNCITVNAVAPTFIDTKMLDDLHLRGREEDFIAQNVVPRMGKAKDVANAVLFLSLRESEFITGETLMVSGGSLMD